jgi:hypothetical protein
MCRTQSEARRFFIEKVLQQAQAEGVPLSRDEQQMLLWSESAPDSVSDPALAERLTREMSDSDYEAKIAGLLGRRFRQDVAIDARTRGVWQQAWSALSQGDHYISIMIDQAVGRQLKPWWRFW